MAKRGVMTKEKAGDNSIKSEDKIEISKKFLVALSFVSILGFLGITAKALFNIDIDGYIESIWVLILGFGLLGEIEFARIKSIPSEGLSPASFNSLTTLIIAMLSFYVAIFSFPPIKIEHPSFIAIKGIVSIIAIAVIIIQSWVVEK